MHDLLVDFAIFRTSLYDNCRQAFKAWRRGWITTKTVRQLKARSFLGRSGSDSGGRPNPRDNNSYIVFCRPTFVQRSTLLFNCIRSIDIAIRRPRTWLSLYRGDLHFQPRPGGRLYEMYEIMYTNGNRVRRTFVVRRPSAPRIDRTVRTEEASSAALARHETTDRVGDTCPSRLLGRTRRCHWDLISVGRRYLFRWTARADIVNHNELFSSTSVFV